MVSEVSEKAQIKLALRGPKIKSSVDDHEEEEEVEDQGLLGVFSCSLASHCRLSTRAGFTTLSGKDFRIPCSNSSSWPMKFRLGDMMPRRFLTNLYASTRLMGNCLMR